MLAYVARKIAKQNMQADKTADVEKMLGDEVYKSAYQGKFEVSMQIYNIKHDSNKILKAFKHDGYTITCRSQDLPDNGTEYIYNIKW